MAAAAAAYALWLTANINEIQIRGSAPFFSLKSMAIKNAKPTLFPNQEVTDMSVYVQMQIENGGQRPADALTILLIRTTIPPSREPKGLHRTIVANPILPSDTPVYSLFLREFEKDEPPQSMVVELRYIDFLLGTRHSQRFYMRWDGAIGDKGLSQLAHMTATQQANFDQALGHRFEEIEW